METDDFSELYIKFDNASFFENRLLPDENVIWSGEGKTPSRVPRLIISSILLLFFTAWTGLLFYIGMIDDTMFGSIIIGTALFGCVFVLMGISAVIKASQPQMPDRYALTDQRVLMQYEGGFESVKLENIRNAEAVIKKSDRGYVKIESEWCSSGRSDMNIQYLFDLKDPEYVCRLILSERDGVLAQREMGEY